MVGRRPLLLVLMSSLLLAHCGVPSEGAEYPDVKLRSRSLTLNIEEKRPEVLETISVVSKLYREEQVSFSQPLPSGFEEGARARLDKLSGGSGLELVVTASPERADLTFRNDFDGDTVRYDVAIAFRITTKEGKLIQKGKGSSMQELSAEDATAEEMHRVFLVAALNAFDQYFAAEETLERLNGNIDSYLSSPPG